MTCERDSRPETPAGESPREHVELGYASTAHRAQGRTVDTAHAYVTATTLRETLYVMASRGRESNLLYIDTAHEPDSATALGNPERVEPVEVLRKVIAASGADLAAHEVRRQEHARRRQTSHATRRLMPALHDPPGPEQPGREI